MAFPIQILRSPVLGFASSQSRPLNSPDKNFLYHMPIVGWSNWYSDNLGSVRVFGDYTAYNLYIHLIASMNGSINSGSFLHEFKSYNRVVEGLFKHPDDFFGHHIIANFLLTEYKPVESKNDLIQILKQDRKTLGSEPMNDSYPSGFARLLSVMGLYAIKDFSPDRIRDCV